MTQDRIYYSPVTQRQDLTALLWLEDRLLYSSYFSSVIHRQVLVLTCDVWLKDRILVPWLKDMVLMLTSDSKTWSYYSHLTQDPAVQVWLKDRILLLICDSKTGSYCSHVTLSQDCSARLGTPDRIQFLTWESKTGRILRLGRVCKTGSCFTRLCSGEKKRQFNRDIDLRMTAACTGLSALRNQWLEQSGSQARHAAPKLQNKYLSTCFNDCNLNIYKCIEHMHCIENPVFVFIFITRMLMG